MSDSAAYDAEVSVSVRVVVHNPDVIERVTGPHGDEWRAQMYNLRTANHVIEHLAYNYVVNGVEKVNTLDGWADCGPCDVSFERMDVFTEADEAMS